MEIFLHEMSYFNQKFLNGFNVFNYNVSSCLSVERMTAFLQDITFFFFLSVRKLKIWIFSEWLASPIYFCLLRLHLLEGIVDLQPLRMGLL